MDEIAGLWEQFHRLGDYTMFQCFAWNQLAANVFEDREAPYVVAAETDSGAAIIPAVIVRQSHVSLLGEEMFDYRDCLWSGEVAVLQKAWAELAKLGLPFRCKAVRGEFGVRWKQFDAEHFTRALSSTPAHARPNVKLETQFDRLLGQGCCAETVDATSESVREMYSGRATSQALDLFQDPLRMKMVMAMVEHAPEGASFHRMVHAGRTVSSVLTFRDGEWGRFYGTHYDRSWFKYSPGVSLAWWVREEIMAAGRKLDYMTGEQHYKQRLADSGSPLYVISANSDKLRSFANADRDLPIAA